MMWSIPEFVLALVFLAGFLAAIEGGFRLGLRRSGRGDESDRNHLGALQAAVLGLLALLLGFTFFMSVSRFDTRKALVLEEANAIGTTYLRARFLPAEQQEPAQGLLRAYVTARLAFFDAGIDKARIAKANADATAIESQLWALAVTATERDPHAVSLGLFIQALNDMIDIQEKRQTALDNHVSEPVLYLLLVASIMAMGLLGHGCGLDRRRRFPSNALFALLIVLVLVTILDLDRPRRGLIEVSQDSMARLAATLESQQKQ